VRLDRNGQTLHQATVWLPVEVLQLIRADRFNLSAFVRQQIELVYGDVSPAELQVQRAQLIEEARESIARQRAADLEREADMERARAAVRVMRAEREAAKGRQDRIAGALAGIVGKNAGTYRRLLPENDPHGDRVDDWEALVRRVSHLCGAGVDSGEVAAGLRALLSKA